jgi:ABC-type transport system involved in multi-copper enzyme maturation permease subunit
LYGKVERPFTLHAGYTRDAFDYLTINTLFFVLFGVVFSAPLFSENYETGADHILRCTKFGRKKLARTKILAHMLMNILMYLIGITLHLIISDLAFGTSTLKTSVQALYDTISLPNMNLFQLQITVSLAGMLSLIAGNAFTYFVSAKQERVAGTLSLSLLIALAPTFIFMGLGNNWLSAILPTGGVGMNNSLLNQLVDFRFLHLGSHSFWTPQVTLLFTIIWIPVFLFLAIRSYSKHQVA